jgi:hypothetical protein
MSLSSVRAIMQPGFWSIQCREFLQTSPKRNKARNNMMEKCILTQIISPVSLDNLKLEKDFDESQFHSYFWIV